jgi:hypothetical protein
VLREVAQDRDGVIIPGGGITWMHTHGGEQPLITFCKRNCPAAGFYVYPWNEDARHARLPGAGQHRFKIRLESVKVQVTVCIRKERHS